MKIRAFFIIYMLGKICKFKTLNYLNIYSFNPKINDYGLCNYCIMRCLW